jgi:transposase-like protein
MSQQAMRVFSTEFKQGVVLRLEGGERLAAVADELKIKRKLLYEWRAAYRAMGVGITGGITGTPYQLQNCRTRWPALSARRSGEGGEPGRRPSRGVRAGARAQNGAQAVEIARLRNELCRPCRAPSDGARRALSRRRRSSVARTG